MQLHITLDGVRELRSRLLDALDDLDGVEQKLQRAERMIAQAGKVVEMIRSRDKAESEPARKAAPKHVELNSEAAFLTVPQLAKRWGCCTRTVYRMFHKGMIARAYLGERNVRIAMAEIARYEAECTG